MLRVLQKFNTFIHDPSSHFTENLQVTVVCETFTNLGITKGSHLAAMKDADARWCKGICGDTMCFEAGPGHNTNKLPFASSGPGLKPTRLQSHCSIQSDDSLKNGSISIFRRFQLKWQAKAKLKGTSSSEKKHAQAVLFCVCTFQRQNMIILISSSAKGAVVIIWRLRSIQSRTFHDHPWPTTRRQPLLHSGYFCTDRTILPSREPTAKWYM